MLGHWFLIRLVNTFRDSKIMETLHKNYEDELPFSTKLTLLVSFYFHTSLWCLERFYEGLYKTISGTGKKCANKNLRIVFNFNKTFRNGPGRQG